MQKYTRLFSVILFWFTFTSVAQAQVGFELSIRPQVSRGADTLFANIYIKRTTATEFALGNSNLLINVNTAHLDTARSAGGMGIVQQGRWSNDATQGGNSTQYIQMLLGRSPQASFVNLQIRQFVSPTGTGIVVPTDSALVARIFFKIKDCKANTTLQWRVGQPGRGAITTFSNTDIYANATFVNPSATIPLRNVATIPTLTAAVTQSSIQFVWPNQPNIIKYEINLNGTNVWQSIVPPTDTFYTITGLAPATTITAQVRAIVPCDTAISTVLSATTTAGCNVLPTAPIVFSGQICDRGQVTLKARTVGATEYRWYSSSTDINPIAGATDSVFITPVISATTIYYVAAVQGGCEGTARTADTAYVNPLPAAPTAIGGSIVVCANSREPYFVQNPTQGSTYEWKVENGTVVSSSGSTVLVQWPTTTGAGAISVREISSKGCRGDSLKTDITINQGVALAFTAPDSVVVGVTFNISVTAPDADTYTWAFGDGSIGATGTLVSHKYTQAGTYQIALVGTKAGFCTDTLRKTIKVKLVRVIYVPNAFSPKANNVQNQTLKVYGSDVSNNGFLFQLYNRWGDMVYQTVNFDEMNQSGWSGGSQELGVYTYVLKGQFNDGQVFDKTGTVTLIK